MLKQIVLLIIYRIKLEG